MHRHLSRDYSHSVVPGGFDVKSYMTRDRPGISLISVTIFITTCWDKINTWEDGFTWKCHKNRFHNCMQFFYTLKKARRPLPRCVFQATPRCPSWSLRWWMVAGQPTSGTMADAIGIPDQNGLGLVLPASDWSLRCNLVEVQVSHSKLSYDMLISSRWYDDSRPP